MNTSSNHIVSDNDLVRGCIAGDRKIQQLLYSMYAARMFVVCKRYSDNSEDAQDILQDGFVKVFSNIQKFRGEGSLEGWMRRIFVNTGIEYFRKKGKISYVADIYETNIEDTDWNVFDNMATQDILNIIHELSPGYKQVFNMYVIEGYSHKEISDILGISEGTSKSQLARAKVILKKIVETKLTTT